MRAGFESFLYTLQSYAPLPLDRVFLFIQLDERLPDVAAKRRRLEATVHELFNASGRLVTLQHRRLVGQAAWLHAWRRWIAPPSVDAADESSRLIFFTQNDEYPRGCSNPRPRDLALGTR